MISIELHQNFRSLQEVFVLDCVRTQKMLQRDVLDVKKTRRYGWKRALPNLRNLKTLGFTTVVRWSEVEKKVGCLRDSGFHFLQNDRMDRQACCKSLQVIFRVGGTRHSTVPATRSYGFQDNVIRIFSSYNNSWESGWFCMECSRVQVVIKSIKPKFGIENMEIV
jgi:hypothetical protein